MFLKAFLGATFKDYLSTLYGMYCIYWWLQAVIISVHLGSSQLNLKVAGMRVGSSMSENIVLQQKKVKCSLWVRR